MKTIFTKGIALIIVLLMISSMFVSCNDNSAVPTETVKGPAGDTPFIGDNGNWWIGSTDTGVKAQGIDGANGKDGKDGVGVTGAYVDENMHLWIVLSDGNKIDAGYVGVTQTEATYTVTFIDYDGREISKLENVKSGSEVEAPIAPDRENFRFTGWDKPLTNITSDTTITAQYIEQFTVTFKGHDGAILKTEKVDKGGNATPPTAPNRTDYLFSGWSGTYRNVTANQTVTATYTQNIRTYTVTFKDYDGTVLKTVNNLTSGQSATAPADPIRNGYTFKKWDKAFDNVTSNLTVNAVYEPISSDPMIVISIEKANAGARNVQVTVALMNNPGIASLNLNLTYAQGLTLTNIVYNSSIGGMSQQPQSKDSPVILNWFNGAADSEGDWVLATLTFDVAANATAGDYNITLTYDPNNVYDITETNIDFEVIAGKIIVS